MNVYNLGNGTAFVTIYALSEVYTKHLKSKFNDSTKSFKDFMENEGMKGEIVKLVEFNITQ